MYAWKFVYVKIGVYNFFCYKFSKFILDGSRISDYWNILLHITTQALLTHIERPFDCLMLEVSSQFIVVFIIFSTADNCFGLKKLKTKKLYIIF